MLENQASSTPATTAVSSDQAMQDRAGKRWTSLGQSPDLQMGCTRLPVFRSEYGTTCRVNHKQKELEP